MSYLSDRLILRWLNSDAQMTDAEQLSKLAQAIAQALSGNDESAGSFFWDKPSSRRVGRVPGRENQ